MWMSEYQAWDSARACVALVCRTHGRWVVGLPSTSRPGVCCGERLRLVPVGVSS